MLGRRRNVVGDNLKPYLGLAYAGNAIYPKVVGAELKADGRRVLRYFFEAEHIAIKLNGGLVKVRWHFHGYVAARSELCVLGHVSFSMHLTW